MKYKYSDSSSTASSSTANDHVKLSASTDGRVIKKHSNGMGSRYKSLNTVMHHQQTSKNISTESKNNLLLEHQQAARASPQMSTNNRSHPPVSGNILTKNVSNSTADLSISTNNYKISSASIRLPTFQSKLDHYNVESSKKIPLSQSFDWGILAITNTNLILLYNKDKSSLVIYDANGHENEVKCTTNKI